MTNEIKEILDILKGRKKMYLHQQKNNSPFNDEEYMAYMILDYITNLQQRIDKALKFIKKQKPWWEEWHYDMCGVDDDIEVIVNILRGDE